MGLALLAAACGDDSSDTSSAAEDGTPSTSADASANAELLGPENRATGDPIRIGFVTDGHAAAFDNSNELDASQATADFLNEHRGGIAGHPIELVTCETTGDPAAATDCGNRMVEEGVVAVAITESAAIESIWEPIHAAGIPTFVYLGTGAALLTDGESTFDMGNPLAALFGLPISVAHDEGIDKIAFVVIDVPAAISPFDTIGTPLLDSAGIEFDLIKVAPGTADMTPQLQALATGDAGLVHVIGDDSFCIAAFNGLAAVGYTGEVTSITSCVTDATREAVPAEALSGMFVSAQSAIGAEDDPTFQLYEAVMHTYSDLDEELLSLSTTINTYANLGSMAAALEGLTGDPTPANIIATIKAMPEKEVPAGGGMTFQCGGSAMSIMPAVCTNQWLRTQLDGDGNPTSYEVEDSTGDLQL